MLTLEQRVKRLERLLKTNESESDTISLFREINHGNGKRTLVRTFTVDDITSQGVVDAIKKDLRRVNFKTVNDYVMPDIFKRFYEDACDNMDDEGVGKSSVELEDNLIYFLCVGNNVGNRVVLFADLELFIEVTGTYDEGDSYEYGGVYGDGWYVDDDPDVSIGYNGMVDSEDDLAGSSPVADKILEVVDGIFEL